MLKKVLNYRSGLLNRLAAPISQYQKCKYSTENAENSASTKSEPPIQPLQLAYNSYEDLSSDPSTSPVIIMHGNYCVNLFLNLCTLAIFASRYQFF